MQDQRCCQWFYSKTPGALKDAKEGAKNTSHWHLVSLTFKHFYQFDIYVFCQFDI